MASTSAPAAIRFPERVDAPAELIAALGAEKVRKLHAAITHAYLHHQPLTIRIQPRDGKPSKLTIAAEVEV